jgi:lipopolysaccharide/colanic/teichoic acid biosynthesis glycosyltransferase
LYQYIKRFFDLLLASSTLLIFVPCTLILYFLKQSGINKHVFFVQIRLGYKNKVFKIFKFATMKSGSDKTTNTYITVANDSRVTKIGSLLRKTKLDELPQIINIFRNEMSFVGPRPLMKESFYAYPREIQDIIYSVKPGITGIGSLIFRDEERLITLCKEQGMDPLAYYQDHIYPYKGALEEWYTRHISFSTDIKILLLTLWVVLRKDSRIVYRIFRDLPSKPEILSEKGLGKWAIGNRQFFWVMFGIL